MKKYGVNNMIYFIAFFSILLGSFAQYFLKLSIRNVDLSRISLMKDIILNSHLYCGILCYILSLLLWLLVLSKLELSKAYPMVSIGYVFTLFFGYLFLGEHITFNKILGISLIIIGVCFLTKY